MPKQIPLTPVWYQPEAPQGSAVRYVASLCAEAVGVELCGSGRKGKTQVASIGVCKGTPARVIQVGNRAELRVYLRAGAELDVPTTRRVSKVAEELEELWPRK